MKNVNFGFIGSGKIAQFSAKSIISHPHARLVAVQDLNEARALELAEEFDIDLTFSKASKLFECEKVDAIYIAVPNKFHAQLSIEALKAGKHVILEKPFAMNIAEAESVIEAAKSSGKVFTLGMNQRFNEDSQKIRSICKEGGLGEIYYAKAYWFRRAGIPKLGTWFGNKGLAGAGAINDIGVHFLDLCLHTIGNFEPIAVSGSTYTKFGNRGLGEGNWGNSDPEGIKFDVDDLASAFIKMKDGTTVTLEVSWACHSDQETKMGIEIFGTEAGAALPPARVFKKDPLNADYEVIENVNGNVPLGHCDRFHNFINHIRGEEALLVRPEEALAVQRILDAVSESCRTGCEVRLDK